MMTTGIVDTAAANGRLLPVRNAVVDDVAEHLVGAADDLDGDVVTERQREREDRPRHRGREQHRQHHPAQGRRAARPEVRRGLQQRVRQPLQPGVHRQDHVGQPQVGERDHRRRSARSRGCRARAATAIQSIGPPLENMPRHAYALTRYDAHSGVSTAITSSRWARGDATFAMKSAIGNATTASMTVTVDRDQQRADGDRAVDVDGEQVAEVVERPGALDRAAERVGGPERR